MSDFRIGNIVLVSDEGSSLNARGTGEVVGFDLGWPVVRPICSVGWPGWRAPKAFPQERLTLAPPVSMPSSQPGEVLPVDSQARKNIPLVTGVLDYFPAALAEVAKVSKAGNDKHNPGEPLHWARGKSMDQVDAIGRHLLERGGFDPDTGMRHSAQLAWRALALLQIELEEAGESPVARGTKEVSQ